MNEEKRMRFIGDLGTARSCNGGTLGREVTAEKREIYYEKPCTWPLLTIEDPDRHMELVNIRLH